MRILNNDEVEKVLDIDDCLDALETAFVEYADGKAASRPRNHTYFPVADDRHPGFQFRFKSQEGGNVTSGVWALRITSDMAGVEELPGGVKRRRLLPLATGDNYVGLIFLFSMRDLELKAIIHDSYIQKWRVALTSALAMRELAPATPTTAALFGAGWQAEAHLEAMLRVRPSIEQVRVFSPTRERRERFAATWSEQVDAEVVPVTSSEAAIEGAQLITCATAAMDPVFDGRLLEPGTHVTSITSPDAHSPRRELDDAAFDRADLCVVFSKEQIDHDNQFDIRGPVERGVRTWDDIHELGDLLAGRAPKRSSDDEVTLFANNTGMGLQFAAVGARILALAERAGLGHEVPAEWFVEETTP